MKSLYLSKLSFRRKLRAKEGDADEEREIISCPPSNFFGLQNILKCTYQRNQRKHNFLGETLNPPK